ncbi:hypothetical protein EOM09_00755 [bacterium]|nr:hypothetical protein [bacterium]
MISFKKVLNKYSLEKKNWILTFFVSFSSFLFFSSIFFNFIYLKTNRYFISFSEKITDFFLIFKSIFANTIMPGMGDLLTTISTTEILENLVYKNPLAINNFFYNNINLILLLITLLFFILISISFIYVITLNEKKSLIKENKRKILPVMILFLIRNFVISLFFMIVVLLSQNFYLNSNLFFTISFFIIFIFSLLIQIIFEYAFRYVVLDSENLFISLGKSTKLLFSKFTQSIKASLISFILFLLIFLGIIIFILPFLAISVSQVRDNLASIFNSANVILLLILSLIGSIAFNSVYISLWNTAYIENRKI